MNPNVAATPHVLIVEDNPVDAELAVRALKRHMHCAVEWAQDGLEAVARLESAAPLPCLVLLDLKMPRMDGLSLLRHLKSDPRTSSLIAVVFTSSREPSDVADAYEAGANSYLVKPVDGALFDALVDTAGHYWLRLNEPVAAGACS
ncbi:MAG: response regulator [Vicinamibacteria bacterium]|nr:response regulator [Vicinamibacteria bacterium]